MTIKEIARNEGVDERSAQRYVTAGYKGHRLPATRTKRGAFVITLDAYRTWRIACGFNEPEPVAQPEAVSAQPQVSAPVESEEPAAAPAPKYPPWPMAANPRGQLTNGPHESSRNWPHPRACEAHAAEQLRKQQERLRGIPNEE
jgi:hypothetical protein